MRRTLTMAAAAAALLMAGGPLPGAEAAGHAAPEAAAAGRWSAGAAESFWTPERMASAVPLPIAPSPDSGDLSAPPAFEARGSGGRAPGSGAADDPDSAPGPFPGTALGSDPGPFPGPHPGTAPGTAPGPLPGPFPDTAPDFTPGPFTGSAPAPSEATPDAAPEPAPAPAPAPVPDPTPPEAVIPPPLLDPASPRLPAAGLGPGVGQDFNGIPSVGRMYLVKGGGAYFCTASVVSSPGRDLVMSAAHCLTGSDSQKVAFVPQYTRANPRPYGMFPVRRTSAGKSRIWIDPRYRSQGVNRAAGLDVAFAQVGPDSDGFPVEDVVGGNRLVTGAGYAHPKVSLVGYPASAARPRLCVNRTTKFTSKDPAIPGSFLRIACTGYPGGTSGGPFLTRYDARTGTGDVVGVIGGWKTGGDTADVSYSSYFGSDVRKLYAKAVAEAKAG
ncbi:trypsin-like peptidase domain-containing protein [Streptomyces sp. NPDC091371]|uniref:trypsin-like peptidase domain-containing protein n=1 Tax=Streptomyces sp. NPDC091371 TaxID=3155303 RepID=UPI003431162C